MAVILLNGKLLPPGLGGHACVDRHSLPRFFPTIWQDRRLGNGKLSPFNLRKLRSVDRFHEYAEEITGVSMDKLIAAQSWDRIADAAMGFFAHLVNEASSTRTDLNSTWQSVTGYIADLAGWAAEADDPAVSEPSRLFLERFNMTHGGLKTNRVRKSRRTRLAE